MDNTTTQSIAPARRFAGRKFLAAFAGLALVLAALYWLLIGQKKPDAPAPIAPMASAPAGEDRSAISGRLADLQGINGVLREQVLALTARLSLVEDALARMGQAAAPAGEIVKLDEAEYLLELAQIRLDLFGDVKSATRAFELADQLLASSREARAAAVRQNLSIELDLLRATPINDTAALSGRLLALVKNLDDLPVSINADDPKRSRVMNLLDRYLVVRREGEPMPAVGRSAWAVREALRIEFQRALLALEQNQPEAWTQSLTAAQQMADITLLAESETATSFKSRLTELAAIPLHAKLPQVGLALRELRGIRQVKLAMPSNLPSGSGDMPIPTSDTPTPTLPSAPVDAPVTVPAPVESESPQ